MTQVRQLSSLPPYSECKPVYTENLTRLSVVGEFKRDNANTLQYALLVLDLYTALLGQEKYLYTEVKKLQHNTV
jgi:hypothetical protein